MRLDRIRNKEMTHSVCLVFSKSAEVAKDDSLQSLFSDCNRDPVRKEEGRGFKLSVPPVNFETNV